MARPLLWVQGASQEPNVGLAADRPPAGAAVYGMFYFATDTGKIYLCLEGGGGGFGWQEMQPGGNPGLIASFTANLSGAAGGTEYCIAPGNCLLTPDSSVDRPYIILPAAIEARTFLISYKGNGGNANTVDFAPTISTDHGATWSDIPGLRLVNEPANLAGFHGDQATLGTAVPIAAGTLLSCVIHCNGVLAGGGCTQISCTLST